MTKISGDDPQTNALNHWDTNLKLPQQSLTQTETFRKTMRWSGLAVTILSAGMTGYVMFGMKGRAVEIIRTFQLSSVFTVVSTITTLFTWYLPLSINDPKVYKKEAINIGQKIASTGLKSVDYDLIKSMLDDGKINREFFNQTIATDLTECTYEKFRDKHTTKVGYLVNDATNQLIKAKALEYYTTNPSSFDGITKTLQLEDCTVLGITYNELAPSFSNAEAKMPSMSYSDFIERNETDAIQYLRDPISIKNLIDKFLTHTSTLYSGLIFIKATYIIHIEKLAIVYPNIMADLVVKVLNNEFKKLTEGAISYQQLRDRNGFECIRELYNSFKEGSQEQDKLIDQFQKLPLKVKLSDEFQCDRNLFKLKEQDVIDHFNHQAEQKPYLGKNGLRQLHGFDCLKQQTLSIPNKTKIQQELTSHLKDPKTPFTEIENLNTDLQYLELSKPEILMQRYSQVSILGLGKEELQYFFSLFPKQLSPKAFIDKLTDETKEMKICEIIRIAPEVFTQGILQPTDEIKKRMEQEIQSISSFEEFYRLYNNVALGCKLIEKDSLKVNVLIKQFFANHARECLTCQYQTNIQVLETLIHTYDLVPKTLKESLAIGKNAAKEAKIAYNITTKTLTDQRDAAITAANREKGNLISTAEKSADLQHKHERVNRAKNELQQIQKQFDFYAGELTIIERKGSEIRANLIALNQEHTKLQRILQDQDLNGKAALIESHKIRISNLEERIRTLERSDSNQKVSALNLKHEQEILKVNTLQKSLAELQAQTSEEAMANLEKVYQNELNRHNGEFTGYFEASKNNPIKTPGELKEMEARIKKLKSAPEQIHKLQTELGEAEKKAEETAKNLRILQKELTKSLTNPENELNTLKGSLRKTRDELAESQRAFKQLKEANIGIIAVETQLKTEGNLSRWELPKQADDIRSKLALAKQDLQSKTDLHQQAIIYLSHAEGMLESTKQLASSQHQRAKEHAENEYTSKIQVEKQKFEETIASLVTQIQQAAQETE